MRVYESKLIEFGIPPEELGFQPTDNNTNTTPAGLVSAWLTKSILKLMLEGVKKLDKLKYKNLMIKVE